MRVKVWRVCYGILGWIAASAVASAQQPLTWQEIGAKFETANPSLRAGPLSIDESRAQEIRAHLRPNPALGVTADQVNPFQLNLAAGREVLP